MVPKQRRDWEEKDKKDVHKINNFAREKLE